MKLGHQHIEHEWWAVWFAKILKAVHRFLIVKVLVGAFSRQCENFAMVHWQLYVLPLFCVSHPREAAGGTSLILILFCLRRIPSFKPMKSFGRKVSVLSFCSKLSARNISNNVETMQRRVQRQGRQVSSVKLQVGLDSDTGANQDVRHRQHNEKEGWKRLSNKKTEMGESKPKLPEVLLYCNVL